MDDSGMETPPLASIDVAEATKPALEEDADEDFLMKIIAKRASGGDNEVWDEDNVQDAGAASQGSQEIEEGQEGTTANEIVKMLGLDKPSSVAAASARTARTKKTDPFLKKSPPTAAYAEARPGAVAIEDKELGADEKLKLSQLSPAAAALRRSTGLRPEARPGAIPIRGPSFTGGFAQGIDISDSSIDSVSDQEDVDVDASHTQSLPGFLVDEEDRLDNLETGELQDESAIHGETVRDSPKSKHFEKAALVGILLLIVVIVLMGLGLGGVFNTTMTSMTDGPEVQEEGIQADNAIDAPTTLRRIKERGFLKCAYTSAFTEFSRFEKSMCEIMTAAILGNQTLMEYVHLPIEGDRFRGIQDQQADIVITAVPHSMERNVLEPTTLSSFSFSKPYLYTGAAVAGRPFYVNCSEDNLNHLGDCQGLRICVPPQGTVYKVFAKALPQRNLVLWKNGVPELIDALNNGTCNAVGMARLLMDLNTARSFGLQGDFVFGQQQYTNGPLAIVTASQDTFFSGMVDAVLEALLAAEQHNITKDTVASSSSISSMKTDLFGKEYEDIFINALKAHGNYGELYSEQFTDHFPREVNKLNDGSTGLIYSHPFRFMSTKGRQGKPLDDSIQRILDRGVLRCGMRPHRKGFAVQDSTSWVGMDVDYCRALSSAVFRGDPEAVEFVEIQTQEAGFQLLVEGKVDVVAGATQTFQNGVREPTTGQAFGFSQPYFYGYSDQEDNLGLATLQTAEKDWSFLVWWVVSASFYAEEQGISSLTSNQMPVVFLYGEDYKRIFRDTVLAVGGHGDIYERHLEPIIPQAGRNLVNSIDDIGAQQYVLPGFLDALNFEE